MRYRIYRGIIHRTASGFRLGQPLVKLNVVSTYGGTYHPVKFFDEFLAKGCARIVVITDNRSIWTIH
jgi:hypothetical protein